jgi:hypothetical protein
LPSCIIAPTGECKGGISSIELGRRLGVTQTTAWKIFAATKAPLCTWFRAMYHLTQSQCTACRRQTSLIAGTDRSHNRRLAGRTAATLATVPLAAEMGVVHLDASRQALCGVPLLSRAVPTVRAARCTQRETTPQGKPIRLQLRRVKGFRRAEIVTLAKRNFNPTSTVVSDGLHCFAGVGKASASIR